MQKVLAGLLFVSGVAVLLPTLIHLHFSRLQRGNTSWSTNIAWTTHDTARALATCDLRFVIAGGIALLFSAVALWVLATRSLVR